MGRHARGQSAQAAESKRPERGVEMPVISGLTRRRNEGTWAVEQQHVERRGYRIQDGRRNGGVGLHRIVGMEVGGRGPESGIQPTLGPVRPTTGSAVAFFEIRESKAAGGRRA